MYIFTLYVYIYTYIYIYNVYVYHVYIYIYTYARTFVRVHVDGCDQMNDYWIGKVEF